MGVFGPGDDECKHWCRECDCYFNPDTEIYYDDNDTACCHYCKYCGLLGSFTHRGGDPLTRYWENCCDIYGKYGVRFSTWELFCNACSESNIYHVKKNKKLCCSSCGVFMLDNKPIMCEVKCKYCDCVLCKIDEDDKHKIRPVCDKVKCREEYVFDYRHKYVNNRLLDIFTKRGSDFDISFKSTPCDCYKSCKCVQACAYSVTILEIEKALLKIYDGNKRDLLKKLFFSCEWNSEIFDAKYG